MMQGIGQFLSDSAVTFLRQLPDAQNVINFYASEGWSTATNDDIRAIFNNWSMYSSFVQEYGTLDGYLSRWGYTGDADGIIPGIPGIPSIQPPFGLSWAQIGVIGGGIVLLVFLLSRD